MIHKIERDNTGLMEVGQDLAVAGWPGFAGTVLAVEAARRKLEAWFSAEYLDEIRDCPYQVQLPGRKHWQDLGIADGEPVGEGGIMTTVWNLSGAYGLGVELVLRDSPLRQETIEICQRLDLNPYRLYGAGSWLLASPNGGRLVKNLEKLGIPAAVMGRVTGGNARAVIHGETVAYLERPRRDELKNLEDYKEAIGHERENSGSY